MDDDITTGGIIEVVDDEKFKFGKEGKDVPPRRKKKSSSTMVAFVLKLSHGLIKNEFQANIVLIVIAIIFFVVSLYYLF